MCTFYAPEDLKIADRFRDEIEHSIASKWVQTEVETAIEREHRENRTVLFPIRLDDAVMNTKRAWAADIRRTRHIGDFSNWKDHDLYRKAFERLMRDLRASAEPDAKAAGARRTNRLL